MRRKSEQIRFFDAHASARCLDMPTLVAKLRTAFEIGCRVPLRHAHRIEVPGADDATLLLMPAWQVKSGREGYLGVKLVNIFPGNTARGIPGLNSSYVLFDSGTGEQLAVIDGNVVTSWRTAAASALAASYLARTDSRRHLILGAGRVASLLPKAYRAVRDVREFAIWDIDPANAERLADSLRSRGMDAKVSHDLETSVGEADIVSAATLSTSALIKGDWLQPGVHVDLIGSFTPDMRESDDEAVRRARVFIDTEEALMKSGDLLHPMANGVFDASAVVASLDQLCRNEVPGRKTQDEITLFKAVGTALEDLAAASMIYESSQS